MNPRIFTNLLLFFVFIVANACTSREGVAVRDSIVQINTPKGSGTGFFVAGPDGRSYVLTAFHVIENGGPITVSRHVAVGESEHYVAAFPETQIVVYDREADLALLEPRNVPREEMPPLPLADPVVNEDVESFGFPNSSLVGGALGLTVKSGKLSNIVQFPVVDRRNKRVVKHNAIKAVIVSSALEPGFSGGPTVNRKGEVVAVNVQKDEAHQAQNGGVHVAEARKLLAKIQKPSAPTASDVAKLISEIQAQYLLLPIAERVSVPESDILSLDELPMLRRYSDGLRWSKDSVAIQLSLSLMPGRTLETSLSSDVRNELNVCVKENGALNKLMQGFKSIEPSRQCGELPVRPLAWDLVAATLRWEGKPHEYTVTQLDEIDPVARHYVAKLRATDDPSAFLSVRLVAEGRKLKLRLFDDDVPFALDSASPTGASDLAGRWVASRRSSRSTESSDPAGTNIASSESVSISIGNDGTTKIVHEVRSEKRAPQGQRWNCNNQETLVSDLVQEFSGTFKNGVVRSLTSAKDDIGKRGACVSGCSYCGSYRRDAAAFFKRLGDRLIMYRFDGELFEEREFVRSPGTT